MPKNTVVLDAAVIEILEAGELRDGKYFLPARQLDRKMYEQVNTALVLMGGKWNRSAKAHVFDRDPAMVLENAIRTGELFDAKKAFQFFPTPSHVAARMVALADVQPHHRVLEPSAGTGNILREIGPAPDKVAVEIDPEKAAILERGAFGGTRVHQGDFMAFEDASGFDRIVMNPPFSFLQDVKHIRHAIGLLRPGGKLVAICANGSRQQEALKPLADTWEELPRDTFEGTSVSAAVLTHTVQ